MVEWDGMLDGFGMSVAEFTCQHWKDMYPGVTKGNRFAIGDTVLYKERQHKIIGTDGHMEYALEGYAFLVWEHELQSTVWKCNSCHCKSSIESTTCTQCGAP